MVKLDFSRIDFVFLDVTSDAVDNQIVVMLCSTRLDFVVIDMRCNAVDCHVGVELNLSW